jgi:DNA (cytosine-5)-methyltransferase 1
MLRAIDFFCGAGGLTRGLLDAGIKVVCGFDIDEGYRLTYERNNAPARFMRADIHELTRREIGRWTQFLNPNELLFAGCAPCQPFTKQRRDGEYPAERTLLRAFGRLVAEVLPGYVIIENVPGIAKVGGGSTYRRFLQTLGANGYSFVEATIDAKSFGVPQTRRRRVVLASRVGTPELPVATHGPGRQPYVTVRQAISEYPRIAAGQTHGSIPNHRAAAVSETNMRRLQLTPVDGGGRLDWPRELHLRCHRGNYSGHTDVYGRMQWDAPAPTLTCRCYSISNGRYGHPHQNRAISLREAARLQSFPDDYIFYGNSLSEVGQQVGNAVPVLLARAMGAAVMSLDRRVRKERLRPRPR